MSDYNEVVGNKYLGVWVSDLTLSELVYIPNDILKTLRLTQQQREDLDALLIPTPEHYEHQDRLAKEYEDETK